MKKPLPHLENIATYIARLKAVLRDDHDIVALYDQQFTTSTLIAGGVATIFSMNTIISQDCATAAGASIGASISSMEPYSAADLCLQLFHPILSSIRTQSCTPQQCYAINDLELRLDTSVINHHTLASIDVLHVTHYLHMIQPVTSIALPEVLDQLHQTSIQRQTP